MTVQLAVAKLADHLAKGPLAAAYLLAGEEDLLRETARREIERAVVGEDDGAVAFRLDRLDGETATVEAVVAACNTLPMLGGRRAVVVRRASRLLEDRADMPVAPLLDYLADPSPTSVLVLDLEKRPDGRRKAWKELQKKAVVVLCDPLKEWEVEGWILAEAKRRGLALDREQARYLAGEFGTDLHRQRNEIEKIALYARGRRPAIEEIAEVLGRGKAQSIFRFTDAVAEKDAPGALAQLGRLLAEGEPPLRILALLDRTVGQLLAAKELGPRSAASRLGVPPRVAEAIVRRARRFEAAELAGAVRRLGRTDRMLKGSGVPARVVLEALVLRLCRGGGAGRQR